MRINNLVYYAIFSYEDDGISIYFPDLPGCISCGYTSEEAMRMAKDALELYLEGIPENMLPMPSKLNEIKTNSPNERVIPIKVQFHK